MLPNHFLDIEVRGAASHGPAAMAALPVLSRLLAALHKLFDSYPGRFAVALPRMRTGRVRHPGNLMRVFAEHRADLDIICTALAANDRILGYVRVGIIQDAPAEPHLGWIEYRRYRIPGRTSRLDKCREYRLTASDELPYLRIGSASNGQAFSVHIAAIPGTRPQKCEPNGYGLSTATRPFALPVV
jgi:hypothetical protein